MKRIFTLLAFFIGILSIAEGYAQLTGDNYPVQAHVYVQRPGLKMPEYFSSTTMLRTDLILKDLTKTTLDVYLGWQITGLGLGVEAGTLPGFVPPNYLTLTKGAKRQLSGAELREYFQPGMLAVSGVGENVIFNGKLPEGFYTIKITAYEAGTGRQVSNTAETFFSVAYALPPVINLPLIGSEQPLTRPQSVLLQWMPRHTATGSNRITYSGKVCEVAEDEDPNIAINGSQNCFTIPAQPGTGYQLKASDLPLKVGKRYAFQVQVTDNNEQLEFQNQGYSEVSWFRFGEACKPPSGLQVNAIAAGRLNVSWNANPQATGYKLLYRSKNQTEWTEQTTLGTSVSLVSLNPEPDYEFKVITVCEIGNESPESETVTREGEGEVDEELEDLIKKVLNPLGEPIVSTGTGIQSAVPGIEKAGPLPETFEDLIPKDPTKIPCQSQLHSYEECSDQHPDVQVDVGNLTPDLSVGDLVTIYDYLVVLTDISRGNPFSGKGLAQMPFLNNVKVPVEFSNVVINQKDRGVKGGCVTEVNGHFRVRNGLTPEQIRQEEIDLIHEVRTNADPGSIYISRGQVITELGEELIATGKDLCDGKPITNEAKQSLLKKHTLAKQGLQDWAEDAADLYSELNLDGTEILSRIQSLITALEANIAIINNGEGCPENPDIKAEMEGITKKIKEDKSKEPTDNLPKITDVVVKNITESEATITWKGDKRFTKYLVSYQTEGQGVVVKEVTKPTLLLSQLDKNKIYNFTIKGIAESSEHTFGPEEFSTLKSSFPPIENLTVLESNSLSYKISWNKDNEHKSYKVEYTKQDGSVISVQTKNNFLDIPDPALRGILRVTAYDDKKQRFSTGTQSISGFYFIGLDGVSRPLNKIYESYSKNSWNCYYDGFCSLKTSCVENTKRPGDDFFASAIGYQNVKVDPLSGNCLDPNFDYITYKSCEIIESYPVKFQICETVDTETGEVITTSNPISNKGPLDKANEEICYPDSEPRELGNTDLQLTSNALSILERKDPFKDGLCKFDYSNCISWSKTKKGCPTGFIVETGRMLKCKETEFYRKLLCNSSDDSKKPEPATRKDVYNDSTYHYTPDTTSLDSNTNISTIKTVVITEFKNNNQECQLHNVLQGIPICYFYTLRNNSVNYNSEEKLMFQPDGNYKFITVKMAPNGDTYFVHKDIEYWQISFSYLIARLSDGKWYNYDFNTNRWCSFTPFEIDLEITSNKRCNAVSTISLKTAGVSPFTYYVTDSENSTKEYTSDDPLIEISDLDIGSYNVKATDANGCLSPVKTIELRRNTSLDFNISKFYDCENTVYITPVCGNGNYLYNYKEDYWDTSNKITGLQNHLILNDLKEYTFSIKVKDGTGTIITKQLNVKSHDYLVKIKSKGLPATIQTVTNDEWTKMNSGLNVGYEPLEYFSDKSVIVVKTNSSLCKPGSMRLEFPNAKLPVQLTIQADNGFSFSGTVNNRLYIVDNLQSGKYKISGTDETGCELYTNNYENDEVDITTGSLKLEVTNLAYNCSTSLYSVKLTTGNSVVTGINEYDWKYLTYDFFLSDEKKATSQGYRGSETIVNLSSGTYIARVEVNSEGCSITKDINLPEVPPLTLTGQVYTDSGENGACSDDPDARVNLSLNVEGGLTPYSFSVSTTTSSYSGNLSVFNNLENTNMMVSVIDKNKCTASFTYQPFDPMLVIPAAQNAACGATGKINVTVTGGNQPYLYNLNGAEYQPSPDFINLEAGTYTVTVKDAFNCTASAEATVEREEYEISLSVTSENPTCGADGVINMKATGGRGTYQYSIDGGNTWGLNSTVDDLCPGTYGSIKVKDTGGCEATAESITLTAPEFIELVTPDGPPVMAMTDPQARAAADEDGVIVISYKGKEYRVKVPQHQKVPGSSYNIMVNGKTYVPLFINCNDTFLGYYEKECSANPCTESKANDFDGVDCFGAAKLKWNGKQVCKQCWLDDSYQCTEYDDIQIYGNAEVLNTTLTELGGTSDATAEAFDYKEAHIVPAKCKNEDIIGYHVFYFNFREDKPVLQIGKNKLEEFKTNYDVYTLGGQVYYVNGEPSRGMKSAAAGALTGNWSTYWEGLKQEWADCLSDPTCAAVVALSTANGALSMFQSKIPATSYNTTANKTVVFTVKEVDDLTELATKQNTNNKVMLGKHDNGGSSGYIKRAGNDHSYFDLGEKWNEVANSVGRNDLEMWRINKRFIDQQKALGKEFYLSHNPGDPRYYNGFYKMEIDYLTKDLKGKIITIKENNLYKIQW